MEEQDKLFLELYKILEDNKDKDIESNRIEKYKEAQKIIINHSKYEYNLLLKEFSCFIKNILKDYSHKEEILVNRCISEKEIVYSDYYTKDAINYLKLFLERNNLGLIVYNKIIVWNENITIDDLINCYLEDLNTLKRIIMPEDIGITLNRKRNGEKDEK